MGSIFFFPSVLCKLNLSSPFGWIRHWEMFLRVMLISYVFVCNYIWSVLFQPYFQKTKTPQSLLIRLKMPYPFPTLQSQQQRKNPWWAAKREKQGKPRSPTLSGQQMAGYHQQEVLWVRRGNFRWEKPELGGDYQGHIGQQMALSQLWVLIEK